MPRVVRRLLAWRRRAFLPVSCAAVFVKQQHNPRLIFVSGAAAAANRRQFLRESSSAARALVLDRISREARELLSESLMPQQPFVGREVTFPGVLPGPHVVWLPSRSSGACLSDELLATRLDWLVRDGLDEVQLRSAVENLVYPASPEDYFD